jgi:hypothetical protein
MPIFEFSDLPAREQTAELSELQGLETYGTGKPGRFPVASGKNLQNHRR